MTLSKRPLVSVYTSNVHEQIKYLHSSTSLIIAKHNHMILSRQAKLYSVNPSFLSGVTLSQTQSQIFAQFHHRLVIKLYMCTAHNICSKHKVTYLQSSMFDNCKTYDPPPFCLMWAAGVPLCILLPFSPRWLWHTSQTPTNFWVNLCCNHKCLWFTIFALCMFDNCKTYLYETHRV